MVAQPRSEEIIQSNSDLRVSQVKMVSERCICGRTRQHEDVRLPIQGLDGHFCNPQYECINKEMGKRTNLWVLESVRSLPTEGRFRSCLPSSSRTRNAASISNELQNKWELLWLCSCALTDQRLCGMWEAAALEWGCEIQCSWWMHTPCGLCHTPLCSSAFNI